MNYMELLTKARDCRQKAEEAKRQLMTKSKDTGHGDDMARWKQQYMRFQNEFENCRQEVMDVIKNSQDPEMMRGIYFRKVLNLPWDEAYRRLFSRRSEMDIRLAVSRYLHENYENWTLYRDCI